MYLIAIGWLYVALMMAVAEASASNGSILGAVFTFVLYGLAPTALVMYLLGTPARKRALKAQEAALAAQAAQAGQTGAPASAQPDAGRDAAADAVAPVRKEP
jgi:mannose/fructose/N-acetylgalactosamine-specific phosphotransferase system component IID